MIAFGFSGMAMACGTATVFAATFLWPPPSCFQPPDGQRTPASEMPQYPLCFAPPDPSAPSAGEMTVIRPTTPVVLEAEKPGVSGRHTPWDRLRTPSVWDTPMDKADLRLTPCPLCARSARPAHLERLLEAMERNRLVGHSR